MKMIYIVLPMLFLALAGCPIPMATTHTPSSDATFASFGFGTGSESTIQTGNAYTVFVPAVTSATSLKASFTTINAVVKVGQTTQASGITPNNFTSPVIYSVSAEDGTQKTFTVTVKVALDWRRYLASPVVYSSNVQGVTPNGSGVGGILLNNPNTNPFADNSPIVLIGTTPPQAIAAQTPYWVLGYGSSVIYLNTPGTGTPVPIQISNDVNGTYKLYNLDWSNLANAAISHTGSTFTLNAHGLSVGDTVYLTGLNGNVKPSGICLVVSVPTTNSFTLSGVAPANSDVFNYLAKVNNTGGAVSF